MIQRGNLFRYDSIRAGEEVIQRLLPDRGVLLERIVSCSAASPPGFWYEQERDEWVVLLQGKASLAWADGKIESLVPGDWVFIPAGCRHRVESTSGDPPAVWLAVHGQLK